MKKIRAWAVYFKPDNEIECGGGACYVGQAWIFMSQDQALAVGRYSHAEDYKVVEVEIRPLPTKKKKGKS